MKDKVGLNHKQRWVFEFELDLSRVSQEYSQVWPGRNVFRYLLRVSIVGLRFWVFLYMVFVFWA